MKGKKEAIMLQQRAHALVWPKSDDAASQFAQFKRDLRDIVLANLNLHGSNRDAAESWDYDEDGEEFFFTISESLAIETKPGLTRRCGVTTMFVLPKAWLNDIPLSIEMLNDDIVTWRKSLHHVRKLQLQHVLATEGQDAFIAATERTL